MSYIFLNISIFDSKKKKQSLFWIFLKKKKIISRNIKKLYFKEFGIRFQDKIKKFILKQEEKPAVPSKKIFWRNLSKIKSNLFFLNNVKNIELGFFPDFFNLRSKSLNFYLNLGEKKNIFRFFSKVNYFKKKIKLNFFLKSFFHQKDCLFNDVLFFFIGQKKYLSKNIPYSNYSCIINAGIDCFWILDNQYHKFWERKKHGGKIKLPSSFIINFFGHNFYLRIWPKSKKNIFKKKIKILKELDLRKHSVTIDLCFHHLNIIFEKNLSESVCFGALERLPETFISYADYNRACLNRMRKNHSRKVFRDFKKFLDVKTLEKNNKWNFFLKCTDLRLDLFNRLKKLGNYISFNLFSLLPSDKHERSKVLDMIHFPFPVEILKYFPGSNKRKMIICWKIPQNHQQRSVLKKNILINKEILNFPIFFSRAMLKKKRKSIII